MKIDFSDITRNLAADLAATEKVVEQVSDRTADIVHDVAKEATPVLTGNLKSRWSKSRPSKDIRLVENDADYAGYVNDGTSKSAPRGMAEKGIDAATRLK